MQTFVYASEDQRKAIHNFRNQVEMLDHLLTLGDAAKAREYLATIRGGNLYGQYRYNTHCPAADAILNQKYFLASAQGTELDVIASDLSAMPLSDQDLIDILGNALDNALEACAPLPGSTKVRIKIVLGDHDLLLTVQNPAPQKAAPDLPSTKKEQLTLHGIGVMSIRDAVERNGGICVFESIGGQFTFSAVIPLP